MAVQKVDEAGRTRPSALYDRIVDVMEALAKTALLTRHRADCLSDRGLCGVLALLLLISGLKLFWQGSTLDAHHRARVCKIGW